MNQIYKILNLYSSLGGNRYKWNEVKRNIQVTAVEIDKEQAKLYKERFPNDEVITTDAHQYLLENYNKYNFIWSSPPCETHSRARYNRRATTQAKYPDIRLYQEIIFLKKWFNGLYCVENVIPYYEPLVPASYKIGSHLYWCNFPLPKTIKERKKTVEKSGKNEVSLLGKYHNFDFNKYKGIQRRDKIARNLIDYELGFQILESAINEIENKDKNEINLFSSVN